MIILSVIKLVPMRTFAGFSHYALSPPRRRPPAGGRGVAADSQAGAVTPRACHVPLGCATLWKRCDETAAEAVGPGSSQGPATGDWLSGRAPRSHRGGHWFDPSIAHPAQRPVPIPGTGLFDLPAAANGSNHRQAGKVVPQVVIAEARRRPLNLTAGF